ncbi:toll-like receptor 6 [Tiliqua scincoides]|uniref:toll-like receptor 6 n=1 Tax=Tiliqua scincoides TaxID=71010 RepID=UPI0034624020
MAEIKRSGTNNFPCICIYIITFWNNIHISAEHEFTANYSKSLLHAVPKKLATETVVLDLSHNTISKLHTSDFRYLTKLQVLILSYNNISQLDFSVFQYNEDLEHLDLSHNNLRTLSCHPVGRLRYLDLSYNNYTAMTVCPEFSRMVQLERLGLSARRIQKSDFTVLAHLQLDSLFLGLEDLSEYSPGHLLMFNVKSLRIVLPTNTEFPVVLDLNLTDTESLELSNIQGKQVNVIKEFLSKLNKNGKLLNLTLNNIEVSWKNITVMFQYVWQSSIEYFTVHDVTILEIIPQPLSYTNTSLKALTIKDTKLKYMIFDQHAVYQTFADMNIKALTISNSQMVYMVCPSNPSSFTYLCFSNNTLSNTGFEGCNNLKLLETLILQKNQFKELDKVSSMTSHMKSLKYLDLSQNLLQYKDNQNGCYWGGNLAQLNLSFNRLSDLVFSCLPINIQVLDLQNNDIASVSEEMVELTSLKELNLASNRLTDLPGCGRFSSLRWLNVEMNSIFSQASKFLQSCENIKKLKGGHNPFTCSCELRQFINLRKNDFVELVDWPESYMCEYPDDLRGLLLKDFHVSEIVCNTNLLIAVVLITTVVLAVTVSLLCIWFDIPWYLKMLWQWSQVKHRGWKNNTEVLVNNVEFHAFISYSECDCDWVKNVLIPNLEKEDGSIRICQHERNFVAGKSIVENIIDCIEKSYKSIFVLSPNFVQSEWCHYELYFAHHKLFSENADNLILILLESIPAYIIPAKYHQLKAVMAKRTYLEWPKEKSKQGLFWANLRASIHVKLSGNEEMRVLW